MIEFEISTNKKQIDFDITQGVPKYVPANFQSKTVIPTTEQQVVRADKPYDGLEQVTVEPIKVLDKTITQNGAYSANEENIDGYSSVFVNVQPNLQEKSITITENGTTEVVADSGYDGLAKVSVEANVKDNSLLNVIKGMNSFNVDTPEYHFELTADIFDENTKQISPYKYYGNKNITKVEIPNSVTGIGNNVFTSCSSLTSITIPDSVTSIGTSAFEGCSSLTSITIPNSVTSIGSGRTFEGCSSLISIIMSNRVKNIASYTFYACMKLAIVDFRGATQVPKVQSNSFDFVPTTCKFIIPDSLYDSWITSTNWVSLYNKGYQFIKASEYTEA